MNFELTAIKDYHQCAQEQIIVHCTTTHDDFVVDDSALLYQTTDGIYIISGCAHSGICNIIEHAKKITGETRVLGVLGAFIYLM